MDGSQALLTLSSVLVGAAASIAGGVWAGKLDYRRRQRYKLRELIRDTLIGLRPAQPGRGASGWLTDEQATAVHEVMSLAAVLGSSEFYLAKKVAMAFHHLESPRFQKKWNEQLNADFAQQGHSMRLPVPDEPTPESRLALSRALDDLGIEVSRKLGPRRVAHDMGWALFATGGPTPSAASEVGGEDLGP